MLRITPLFLQKTKGRKATDADFFFAYHDYVVVPAGSTYAGYLQVSSYRMQVS